MGWMGAGRPASSPLPRPWPRGGRSLASVSCPGKLEFDAWSPRLCLGVPRPTLGCLCQCPPSLCTAGPGRSREVQPRIPLTRGLAASSERQGGLAGARASSPLQGAQPSPLVQHPQSATTQISTVHLLSSWTGNIPCCFDSRSQPKIWGGTVLYSKFSLSGPPLGPCTVLC